MSVTCALGKFEREGLSCGEDGLQVLQSLGTRFLFVVILVW